MSTHTRTWPTLSIVLGLVCTALGCWAAYIFGKKLDGGELSYLALAAPVVAGAAGLIPVFGELSWKAKQYFKSTLWWLILIPVGYTVATVTADRVQTAQAPAQAERQAHANAAARAKAKLTALEAEAKTAKVAADKTRGWAQCGNTCKGIRATSERLEREVADANKSLTLAEASVHQASPLWAPPWLIGVALDLTAFIAIWSGTTGWVTAKRPEPAQRKKRRTKTRARKPRRKVLDAGNDNIVPLRVA